MQYLRQCRHLVLCKGVLYRSVTPSKEDQNALLLAILQSYQKGALQGCHDHIRHMGFEWMLDLLWDYCQGWRRMQNFTLWGAIDASDSSINHKEQPGYPSTTVGAFGLYYDQSDRRWKECSCVNHYWSFYKIHTGPGNVIRDCLVYSPSFVGLICGPVWPTRKHNLWSGLEFQKWPHFRVVQVGNSMEIVY